MYQQAGPSNNLPVPHDRVDQSTFSRYLPQQNDVFPPIQPPPTLDVPTLNLIPGKFRERMQASASKSPVNTFAYNLLSQNYFNNQIFTEWVQRVADFVEMLIVCQGEAPQQAVDKAVVFIYRCMLAGLVSQYQALMQLLPPALMTEIQQAARDLQDVIVDINAFHQRGRTPPPQANPGYAQSTQMGGYGNQPQAPGYGPQPGYGPTMQQGYQPHGQQLPPVTGRTPTGAAPQPYQASVNQPSTQHQGPRGIATGGRYGADSTPYQPTPAPTQPTSTWTGGQTPNVAQPVTPMQPQPTTPQPTSVMTEENVPMSLDDIDLESYRARGSDGPYDHVILPGGVEAIPYHKSPWTRTRTADKPYAVAYDPQTYALFHIKWPDGLVEEYLVRFDTMAEMNYLKHEIDAELRGTKIKPDGKVVASTYMVKDMDTEPKPVEEVKKSLDEGVATKDSIDPVILDGEFTGSSDLDNEVEARHQIVEQLGLKETPESLPGHEYTSVKLHAIDVSKEGRERLEMLATTDSLIGLAQGFIEGLNDGVISLRYYRFFDARFTRMINQALTENMGLEDIEIDSFMEDIGELFEYLTDHYGDAMAQVLKDQTKALLNSWFNLREEDTDGDIRLSLVDTYVNLQLSWSAEALVSLPLSNGEPLLLSSVHPNLMKVVRNQLNRRAKEGGLGGKTFRLITADGVYLTVLRGWLVENAVLIKKS